MTKAEILIVSLCIIIHQRYFGIKFRKERLNLSKFSLTLNIGIIILISELETSPPDGTKADSRAIIIFRNSSLSLLRFADPNFKLQSKIFHKPTIRVHFISITQASMPFSLRTGIN